MNENLRILKPFFRGLPIIILAVGISILVAKKYLNYVTPMYESTAKLKLADVQEGVPSANLFKDFDVFASANKIATEIEVLKSALLIEKAIDELPFNKEIYRKGSMQSVELFRNSPILIEGTFSSEQHIIAKLVGFEKWTEMLKASPPALELAKLLLDNMRKIRNEEWGYYILDVENENSITLDDEDKLDIFKTVFADVDGHQSDGYDYRLAKREKPSIEKQKIRPMEKKSIVKINTLPLAESDLKEFINVANKKFEDALQSIEHSHPELVRKLWNPEQYIEEVIKRDMLPIDRDYALSLVEAFLIHKVIELATTVDKEDLNLN